MTQQIIGFVGGGNMAAALIGGLVDGGCSPEKIMVFDLEQTKLLALQQQYGINLAANNLFVAENADVLVFAVKPQIIHSVANEMSAVVQAKKPIIISIAAGVRERDIESWMGGAVSLIRCMPNTPALVRSGATALHANNYVSEDQRDIAETILRSVGLVVWVEREDDLDAVTALSGSGPAYFFLLMEAMNRAAEELGLDKKIAQVLVEQTALGAAKVALEVEESPADLRRRVTSPGGTTERAINVFENGGMQSLVVDALRAAHARSIEMSDELGGK